MKVTRQRMGRKDKSTLQTDIHSMIGNLDGGLTLEGFVTGTWLGVTLSADEIARAVAAQAPYDPKARGIYFANLRALADRIHPTER